MLGLACVSLSPSLFSLLSLLPLRDRPRRRVYDDQSGSRRRLNSRSDWELCTARPTRLLLGGGVKGCQA